MTSELAELLQLDQELVAIAENFKILALVEWPKKAEDEFISGWKSGSPKIPTIEYPKHNFSEKIKKLEQIIKRTDLKHPIAEFIHQTAKSYYYAYLMIENLGRPEMTQNSIRIYGQPADKVEGTAITNIEAAHFFIEAADLFDDAYQLGEEESCILADSIRDQLDVATKQVITDDKVDIIISDNLVPKAAAGVTRVRLRSGTCYSRYDFQQLLHHEVFVHTLTAINGRNQKQLKSLRLGSPRTTGTQEGLATFAELVTGSIDLGRLKRIALRVIATDMALKGANFFEIYKFFTDSRQSNHESFSSARRIFRGGDPNGGIVFTKDSVYLDGLLTAHSFFRWAMKNHRLDLARVLFSGRMTFEDAVRLTSHEDTKIIDPPKYLPPWIQNFHSLGAYLAFSLFANKIKVDNLNRVFGA
jgi:uncharacterized protein (TIGR02421 family)